MIRRTIVQAWLVVGVVVAGLGAAHAGTDEDWYTVNLSGEKAGWMVQRSAETETGNLVSEMEMHFAIGRGDISVEVSMGSRAEETPDGEPVEVRTQIKQGMQEVCSVYEWTEDGIRASVTQGERTTTRELGALSGEFLMPAAAERYVKQRLEAGDDTITVSTIDALQGLQVVVIKRTIVSRTEIETVGKVVPAVEWEVTQSVNPTIVSREFVDETGELLRATSDLGGALKMEVVATEKAIALSDFSPPELMASTLVELDAPIEGARSAEHASYLLRVGDGSIGDLADAGAQRVERIDDATVRVIVDADAGGDAPADTRAYLDCTPAADCADPMVKDLARRAVAEAGSTDAERAEALRRFVHEYIDTKDLGVGFATASEVCRTKQGDCSEHALLLAAMLRAEGIPSRAVSGLLYVDSFLGSEHVFGYHMWTQALLERDGRKQWVDLDAVLGPERAFDATHIAISTSTLAETDVLNSLVPMTTLLGSLEIEVESVE